MEDLHGRDLSARTRLAQCDERELFRRYHEAGDAEARAALVFQAGRTTLGPVALGPAPKVYEAR